jgi:hypothetical protein
VRQERLIQPIDKSNKREKVIDMLTFKTTSDRIIKILENNLTELDKHRNVEFNENFAGKIQSFFNKFSVTKFNISKSTNESIELKVGEYIITLNFKDQKGGLVNLMTDITFNPNKKKKKYGAVEKQTGQKYLNKILGYIYKNLNENELTDDSKENYNLIIEAEKKSNKIGEYNVYGSIIVVIGFFVYSIFSYFDPTIEACNGWTKDTSDMCLVFDKSNKNNRKMTIHVKNYYGEWEERVTHPYRVEKKSMKYQGEMLDKIITKGLTGFQMILVQDGSKIYRVGIGSPNIVDTFYIR